MPTPADRSPRRPAVQPARPPAISRRALLLGLACSPALAADSRPALDAGRPDALAQQAVALLADAASHGLDPQDYAVPALQQALAQPGQAPADAQRLQALLGAALQRYLGDLHRGRVDPRELQQQFSALPREPFDAAAVLQAARAGGTLADALRNAAPPLPQYQQLREALAHYRALAAHPAWQTPLPALPVPGGSRVGKLEPGSAWAGLALLAQRLSVLGDLPADAAPVAADTLYAGALVDAVRSFQQRHGLAEDGIIGRATWLALQVTPAARARQIELALERLRWTPLQLAPRMIVINIPEFVLRAYEVQGERIAVRHTMKVVVGKALDTRTPLFDAEMRAIEFSPYWNVPPSIARAETVPALRRRPGDFERLGYEFVAADGSVSTVLSKAALDAVLAGTWRIRQRPGPLNALGDIKFVFPNAQHIFLHHTPATRLFERERRDFSHGCIRVEQPLVLAQFVLAGRPDWTEERIRQAMGARQSFTLRLDEPVRVLIAYGTALMKRGRLHFFDDIYGQDRLLDAALRQPRSALVPLPGTPP